MLRRTWMAIALVALVGLGRAAAQENPFADETETTVGAAVVKPAAPTMSVTRTPEMWFYEQERIRSEDPAVAVRRKAEFRAAQRAARLAAQQWYGISNSRPYVSVLPHSSGSFSPYWGSNTYDPFRWRPYQASNTVIMPVPMRY